MNLLHTSDWHLGRALYGRQRTQEFEAFLDWLAQAVVAHDIDVLLVAGDVFDTSTPGNRAQALYYRFLCRVAASRCRHVVVIAGNHDSPTFLDAPRELLKALDVHVVGQACADPDEEVLVLSDADGRPELIVCAVPYLRDRDLRTAQPGESVEDKERKLQEGIRDHYASVVAQAVRRREALRSDVPMIGMGHLFTAGGQTVDGDGVRDLYVGSLAHIGAGMFPEALDYVALGHLHVPQQVGGTDRIRYSGSPLPMGFGEAAQRKSVCLVRFDDVAPAADCQAASGADALGTHAPSVTLLDVPVFQTLASLRGDWDALSGRLQALKDAQAQAWLEVTYEGDEVMGDLRERLDAMVAGSDLEILRVRNLRLRDQVLSQMDAGETLEDLSVQTVFERCLDAHAIPEAQRPGLLQAYRETLSSLDQDDPRAQ